MAEDEAQAPADTALGRYMLLARHYLWKDIRARAAPWQIPEGLLAELARRTAQTVPALGDPIVEVEWHIEHILTLAREYLHAGQRQSTEALVALCLAARQPAMTYLLGAKWIEHRAPDSNVGCRSALPAAVCGCGKYLLIQSDVDPAADPRRQ